MNSTREVAYWKRYTLSSVKQTGRYALMVSHKPDFNSGRYASDSGASEVLMSIISWRKDSHWDACLIVFSAAFVPCPCRASSWETAERQGFRIIHTTSTCPMAILQGTVHSKEDLI